MKTQTPTQGISGYEKLQLEITLLSHQPNQNEKDIRHLISLAKRCSKSPELKKNQKEKCQAIVTTWKKFL